MILVRVHSERKEGNYGEYIKDRMQNVGRNVTVKGGSDGVSGGNEEHVTEQ